MMCSWLPKEEFNIPPYAHTMVGVGAVVVNDKHQVLVVSEKNALVKDSWKLPGGYLERSKLYCRSTSEIHFYLSKSKFLSRRKYRGRRNTRSSRRDKHPN